MENIKTSVYDVYDIMRILKIGRTKAYTLIKSGEFNYIKIGRSYRVPITSFNNWLNGGASYE